MSSVTYQARKMSKGIPRKLSNNAMTLIQSHSEKIATRLIQIALNDKHDNQLSAIKICMDRLVPIQKAVDASALGGQVNIQVNVKTIQPKDAT